MEEIWKEVPFAPNYEASTHGRVRNNETKKVLKQCLRYTGYYELCITVDKIRSTKKLHQIIAITFIDNPENKDTVNHKDHDKTNNNISNLEWMTRSEQNKHSRRPTGILGQYNTGGCRSIWKCDINTGERLERFESITQASISLSGSSKLTSTIGRACKKQKTGKNGSSNGFNWEFEEVPDLEGEEWKEINPNHVKGAEGYSISSMGRIKTNHDKICNPYDTSGYLCHSVKKMTFKAHRLVALTFLDNPDGKPIVNHLNGDKHDCSVSNLEWCTHSENSQHASDTNLSTSNRKVRQYTLDGSFVKEYGSITQAEKENDFKSIVMRNKSSYGFQWRYIEDDTPVENIIPPTVRQYDLDGNFIKEFDNIKDLCNTLNVTFIDFRGATSHGYQWRKSTDYTPINNLNKELPSFFN